MGIHISEESENKHTAKEIWESTAITFLSKFIFASTFVIPILLFPLSIAMIVSVIWGLSLITVFSFYMARQQNANPYKIAMEHLAIAILVIIATHYLGAWVATFA